MSPIAAANILLCFERGISIRCYVSTVIFLGFWIIVSNTNIGSNSSDTTIIDDPTIATATIYGQAIRKTATSTVDITIENDINSIRSLVEKHETMIKVMEEKIKRQDEELKVLQLHIEKEKKGENKLSTAVDEARNGTPSGLKTPSTSSTSSMLRKLGGGESKSANAILKLEDRLTRLELITKGYINWITDPYIGSKATHKCSDNRDIAEHYICFDDFMDSPPSLPSEKTDPETSASNESKCVIYDFGIREQPEFGKHFAESFPHCEVHAFDPSPTSVQWWERSDDYLVKELKALPNYHFHDWGAGGVDGDITLYAYNWGQVSSVQIPFFISSLCDYGLDKMNRFNKSFVQDPNNYHELQCLSSTDIKYVYNASEHDFVPTHEEKQQPDRQNFIESFRLNVKTLKTTMKELGHSHIDVLKLDVEGSEYQFLESTIDDFDCPPISQMSVEWHHYSMDPRYGGGSSPEMNSIVTYLHDRCKIRTYQGEEDGGYCSTKLFAKDSGDRKSVV